MGMVFGLVDLLAIILTLIVVRRPEIPAYLCIRSGNSWLLDVNSGLMLQNLKQVEPELYFEEHTTSPNNRYIARHTAPKLRQVGNVNEGFSTVIVSQADSKQTMLVQPDAERLSWSPDSQWVSLIHLENDKLMPLVANIIGTQRYTTPLESFTTQSWSWAADSSYVVLQTNLPNGARVEILSVPNFEHIRSYQFQDRSLGPQSAHGHQVALIEADNNNNAWLTLLSPPNEMQRVPLRDPNNLSIYDAQIYWSPDGYNLLVRFKKNIDTADLFIIRAATSQLELVAITQLTWESVAKWPDPVWSSNNQDVVFWQYELRRHQAHLTSVNLASGQANTVLNDVGVIGLGQSDDVAIWLSLRENWSGARMLVPRQKPFGTFDIELMDRDGNNAQTIIVDAEKVTPPLFSNDGQSAVIVWKSSENSDKPYILTWIDLASTTQRNMPGFDKYVQILSFDNDGYLFYAAPQPDKWLQVGFVDVVRLNKKVLANRAFDGDFLTVDAGYIGFWWSDGTSVGVDNYSSDGTRVSHFVAVGHGTPDLPPEFLPDKQSAALVLNEDNGLSLQLAGPNGTVRMPLEDVQTIFVRWSPDGTQLGVEYWQSPPLSHPHVLVLNRSGEVLREFNSMPYDNYGSLQWSRCG